MYVRQTIEHILTECPDLKEERKKHFPGGKVKMHSMVLDPEKCRKFLSAKFDGLKISADKKQGGQASKNAHFENSPIR